MRSIEIIVLIFFAVIVSGLLLVTLIGMDFELFSNEALNTFFKPEVKKSGTQVNLKQLGQNMDKCWKECQFGLIELNCGVFVLANDELSDTQKESGLNRNEIFFVLDKFSFCENCNFSISSTDNNFYSNQLTQIICSSDENKIILKQ